MKISFWLLVLSISLSFILARAESPVSSGLKPANLRCEYRVDPLGIDVVKPRLSWILEPVALRGQKQTAYQILVAGSLEALSQDQGDLWDTGKRVSGASIQVEYAGKPLQSRTTYHWKVRAWDKDGHPGLWSTPAQWQMGLLSPDDWHAAWIGYPVDRRARSASRWLRKTFELNVPPVRATAYVAVAGYVELYVNGRKVGSDLLSPAVSDFRTRSFYVTYDITPYLRDGRNCIGLWLGLGWFGEQAGYCDAAKTRPPGPRARVQCEIDAGGQRIEVTTGPTWKAALGPYHTTGEWQLCGYGGERYNARMENPDWASPRFDDSAWAYASTVPPPAPHLEAQPCPLNKVGEWIPAVDCRDLGDGRYELDFGTTIAGWVRLKLPRLKSNQLVRLTYADKWARGRGPDDSPAGVIRLCPWGERVFGTKDHEVHYQAMGQVDEFISASAEGEEFSSKFAYHGFRYVVVEGLPSVPVPADARALMIESDLEPCGSFECSNDLFNRIHAMTARTIRCVDLGGVLAASPNFDRRGFGDAQAALETCMMNRWMPAFYTKWMQDWRGAQDVFLGDIPKAVPFWGDHGGPAWGGNLAATAWRMYLFYGDRRILEQSYEPMRKYIDFLESHCTGNILRTFGGGMQFLGDALAPEQGFDTKTLAPNSANEFFNNCYRVYLWELLEKSAAVLGREDEVKRCRTKLGELRPVIWQAFHDPKKPNLLPENQACHAMPLLAGIVPAAERDLEFHNLDNAVRIGRGGHLDTGVLGTYFLIQCLQENGHNDLLSAIATAKGYPGWEYMVSQGATTLWQQWNGYGSRISLSYGSLDGWFFEGLAGIRPDETAPGFKKFVIQPALVPEVAWVKASYDSAHGRIASSWKREGGTVTLNVTVPANTTATIYVPAVDAARVLESGKPIVAETEGVKWLRTERGASVYQVEAGSYSFQANSK